MRIPFLAFGLATALSGTAPAQSSITVEDPAAYRRALARRAHAPRPPSTQAIGVCDYTLTQLDLPPSYTGTGYSERIKIMTPCGYVANGPDVPLIVLWNGWAISAGAIYEGMSAIPDEANLRGWLMVSVTGVDDKGFGAPKPQQNVAAAVRYMTENYTVDENRIYAFGWSAGGGAAATLAARNLNPERPMFAALVTNAGAYDLVGTYHQDPSSLASMLMEHPALFEGPPVPPFLWNYLRSETVDTLAGITADAKSSQMRNLVNVPIYHVYSTDDPLQYLVAQNQTFAAHLSSLGANITTTTFTGLVDPHDWSLVDAKATLDWCQAFTVVREPPSFQVNADRDDRFYWADVDQRVGGTFSSLHARVADPENGLELLDVSNVERLRLTPPAGSFDPNSHFTLFVESNDPAGLDVVIAGVTAPPTYVLLGDDLFVDYVHDAGAKELTLKPPDGASDVEVRFDGYAATLAGPASAAIGTFVDLKLAASTPHQPFVLLLGFDAGVFPIATIDPNDDRYLLLDLAKPFVAFPSQLGPSGSFSTCALIPNDVALIGARLHAQFVTLPGSATLVDEISPRLDVDVVAFH